MKKELCETDSRASVCLLKGCSRLINSSALVMLFQVQRSVLQSSTFCDLKTGKRAVGCPRIDVSDTVQHTRWQLAVRPPIDLLPPCLKKLMTIVLVCHTKIEDIQYRNH
jgi:hypothetical protein